MRSVVMLGASVCILTVVVCVGRWSVPAMRLFGSNSSGGIFVDLLGQEITAAFLDSKVGAVRILYGVRRLRWFLGWANTYLAPVNEWIRVYFACGCLS